MTTEKQNWLDRPIHPALPGLSNEILLFAGVILLTFLTRFYDLESRVMSHDESLHTYFSWLLYRGQGYEHTPMMHGPLQFHLLALTYFIFGVNDFTSRIPAVLFSIATVWMVWYWRRYLGKTGALVAAFLMVISPYMLYYGRYVRNEAYAGLAGILLLFAILRFLETGGKRYLYMVTAALLIHFTAKETAFIYAAQALLFLGIYFVVQVTNNSWEGKERHYRSFLIALILGLLLMGAALGFALYKPANTTLTAGETAMPANPEETVAQMDELQASSNTIPTILIGAGVLSLIFAVVFLITGYTWQRLKEGRTFSLLMLIGTLILPLLTPLPIALLEPWLHITIPTTAPEVSALMAGTQTLLGMPREILIIGVIIFLMFGVSILLGQLWSRDWWKHALLYWSIFIFLFTAVFTNSDGFFTGLIGSLGYWLVQQDVERGSQPWYFYVLVQIPIYEFLPALGTLLAAWLGIKKLFPKQDHTLNQAQPALDVTEAGIDSSSKADPAEILPADKAESDALNFSNTFSLLGWWVVTSIIALSYAGERMPWLTYHMAWPMVLLGGWGLGSLIESIEWDKRKMAENTLKLVLSAIFLIGFFNSLAALSGPTPPFQGKDMVSLQATNAFLLPALITIASAVGLGSLLKNELFDMAKIGLALLFVISILGVVVALADLSAVETIPGSAASATVRTIVYLLLLISALAGLFLLRRQPSGSFPAMLTLTFFAFLTVLTVRASFRAAYINYDKAMEYLVYAHGAGPIKQVMRQAEEISRRTTGGMDMILAYDASAPDTGVSWPFVWYLRDFTTQRAFDQPTKSLRDSPFIIVDAKNFDKIEPAIGTGYYRFDYIRMWWPNQDYFGLTQERIMNALRDPQIRAGLWEIWFNRDYTRYAQATGHTDMTEITWEPADRMRLYIRKDVTAQIWNYGAAPVETVAIEDPTEGKDILLSADRVFDQTQENSVPMNAPRSLAFAPDGSMYVADSRNHRILHLDTDGNMLNQWGTFADGLSSPAAPGEFNEPWGVAVGPDGSVYVTDTWNHRVQKFTSAGRPVTTWGQYGTADMPDSFWGPRGIAVDAEGFVYVADTGNKRIVVFDSNGTFISEFGSAGLEAGEFDEPVGVAVDNNGNLFVADTWNQRVQTFNISPDRMTFLPDRQWDVFGWYGQSLDNKPFVAVNADGHVFITDPEQYRVIEFASDGEIVRTWGDFGDTFTSFGLTSGIAVDMEGHIWVTDPVYNRILQFTLPE